jgi:putative membrane protein insertion efficiency factor
VNAAQHILILGVRLYQWLVSPVLRVVLGPLARCRFEPTCSGYAIEAVRVHGALAGSWLALKRIGRCQPWGSCGHDPVPEKKFEVQNSTSETNQNFDDRSVTSPALETHAVH